MAHSAADKRRVYLACRAIFAGYNAQPHKSKKIKEVLQRHKNSLGSLIRGIGETKVIDIINLLLGRGIFQSELKAKVEFPDLFLSTPGRAAQHAASENDATRSEAEILEEITSLEERESQAEEDNQSVDTPAEVTAAATGSPNPVKLYPSYLPYKVQHIILTTAQRILEECCFDFAEKWLPLILQENSWECAAAVELTKWTRILAKHASELPTHAVQCPRDQLREALYATSRLRHTAVHRLSTTARGVDQLIQSAQKMTETLHDSFRASQLEELHREIDSKIKALELNKNALEDNLNHELQQIQRQREELDQKEQDLIATTLREDQENKSLIGLLLEESIEKIFNEDMTLSPNLEKDEDEAGTDDEEEANGVEVMVYQEKVQVNGIVEMPGRRSTTRASVESADAFIRAAEAPEDEGKV